MTTRALQIECLLDPIYDYRDNSLAVGYTVYFYAAGTSDTKNVWTEKEKTNPYTTRTLGSDGTVQVYGEGIYKIIIKDADGTTVYSWDNIKIEAVNFSVVTKTSTYTATPDDDVILVDTDGGNVTINLQALANFTHPLVIKNVGSNSVIVDANGSETIDGNATVTFTAANYAATLYPGPSEWKLGQVASKVSDADGDTYHDVEESSDEDKHHFYVSGTDQIILEDGVLYPVTDNDIDLGKAANEFKDLYIDGTANIDTADVDLVKTDTINEQGAGNGVTIDGSLIKDGVAKFDTINEKTASSGVTIDGLLIKDGQAPWPYNYKYGLTLSNDTDSDHDIQVAVGSARDSSDSYNINLSSALTKQIDANWAAGDDAGGFPSGLSLSTSTWYHVYLIYDVTNNLVDAGYDTSTTAANLLTDASDYTKYRRIGSVLTDGSSNITAFIQVGDIFRWVRAVLDVNVSNQSTTYISRALSVPPDVRTLAQGMIYVSNAGLSLGYVRPTDALDDYPAAATAPLGFYGQAGPWICLTNTSKQVATAAESASTTLRMTTEGWREFWQ